MSDTLKVACPHCDGTLKLKDRSAAGKRVRCPKCGESFTLELPDEDVLDIVDDFEDDLGADGFGEDLDDDMEVKPKAVRGKGASKRKGAKARKGGGIPWLTIGLVLLAVFATGGLGAVAMSFLGGGSTVANKIDLKYLPADSNLVMQMRVNDFFNCALLSDLLNQPSAQQMFQMQEQGTGINSRQITTMTIGCVVDESAPAMSFLPGQTRLPMPGMPGQATAAMPNVRFVTVVRSSTSFDPQKIAVNSLKAVPTTHSGTTYFKSGNGANFEGFGGEAMYFPESGVMVVGKESDIVSLIGSKTLEVRRPEFDIVNPQATILMAFAPRSKLNPDSPISSPANQPHLQALERAINKTGRGGMIGITLSDRLDLEVTLKCADGTGAAEVKQATEALFSDLKAKFAQSKVMLSFMQMDDVASLGEKALGSLKVETQGSLLMATGTVPSEVKSVGQRVAGILPSMLEDAGNDSTGAVPPVGQTSPGDPGNYIIDPSKGEGPPLPSQFPNSGAVPGTLPANGFPPGTVPPGSNVPPSIPPGSLPIPNAPM